MHNLEQSIAAWRKTMTSAPNVTPKAQDELEDHLREIVAELLRSGMAETEAFQRAVAQLGAPATIAAEFQKLSHATWLPVKVVTAIGVAVAMALCLALLAAFQDRRWDLLLATHVFTVTLGYSTTLLIGILGICFVCQRSRADFSPRRLESISRATFTFARVAACLTALGIVLGVIWTKREWGRFWGWDAKEIGALCVMVWLICFLAAQRVRWITARGFLVLGVLGSNTAALAWFWPQVGLHSYGRLGYAPLLLSAVTANLLFFLVGLAPAGWLRLKKA